MLPRGKVPDEADMPYARMAVRVLTGLVIVVIIAILVKPYGF